MSKISEHIVDLVRRLSGTVVEVSVTARRASQVRFRLELAQSDSGVDPAGRAFRDDDSIINQITNSLQALLFGQRDCSYLTAVALSNALDMCAICAPFRQQRIHQGKMSV